MHRRIDYGEALSVAFCAHQGHVDCRLSSPSGALDLVKLANGMKGKFPANTALIDQMLGATGTFEVKLVVNEIDLRHADGYALRLRGVTTQARPGP